MHESKFEILEIMIIKLLIISIILVAIIMLGLGVKLLFNPDAEFSAHSCALEDGSLDKDGACSKCQLKELADCPENKDKIESLNPDCSDIAENMRIM